jgi:hypothetical protein
MSTIIKLRNMAENLQKLQKNCSSLLEPLSSDRGHRNATRLTLKQTLGSRRHRSDAVQHVEVGR